MLRPFPLLAPDSPFLNQVLYKVCNSFVEMGSANVQAADYLKGVGQYFPLLAGLLSPCPQLHQDRGGCWVASFCYLHYGEMGSQEPEKEWLSRDSGSGILTPGEYSGHCPPLPARQQSCLPGWGTGQGSR